MDSSRVDKALGAVGHLRAPWGPTASSGWATALVIASLLVSIAALTYVAGGTRTVVPHALYLPIVLAGAAFGFRGALVTATAAALLVGPMMPLDVAASVAQSPASWVTRGLFLTLVGATVGALFTATHRSYRSSLAAHLEPDLVLDVTETPSLETVRQVKDVLARRSFHPVFQPIYSLGDGRLRAVEALTRFDTDLREPPNVWFARARNAGRHVEMDLAAIEAALAASYDLPSDVDLCLNCSPATICDDRLVALLDRFPRRRLILEITEHEVVDDYRQLEQALPRLRRRGIALAVDDAGAGFASFRHIHRLAPEIIKLDISLSQGLRHDPVLRTLAECILGFASRIGSELIAEGIEDQADLAAWRELGADAVQGFLLGRPGDLPLAGRSPLLADGRTHVGSGEPLGAA